MKMQVAKLFSSMGFEIDTAPLEKFEGHIRNMRASSTLLARNLRVLNSQLNTTKNNISGVNKGMDATNSKKQTGDLGKKYGALATHIFEAEKKLARFGRVLGIVEPRLISFDSRLNTNIASWDRFNQRLAASTRHLTDIRNGLRDIRSTPPIPPLPPRRGSQGGPSGGGGGSTGAGLLAGGALARFAGTFTPTGLLVGGGATAGVAVKELVQAGREMQKMQTTMLMASKGTEEWQHNLEFVRKTANEIGVDVTEFGQAYAKMLQATLGNDKLTIRQKEEMFSNLSKYMVTIGMTADDQKGTFRALTQMFTKGKVQAEEILQMAERGVPAAIEIKKAAMEGLKMTEDQFNKAQQKGQLDPSKLLPIMSASLAKLAVDSGAYAKATNSSQAAQTRLNNAWKEFAGKVMTSGFDEALGRLFNSLADLLQLMIPLAKGFAEATLGFVKFIGVMKDFSKENPMVMAGLGGLVTVLLLTRSSAFKAAGMSGLLFSVLIRGIQGLKFVMARFPITAAFLALFEIFSAFKDAMDGKHNWLTTLSEYLQLAGAYVDLVIAKFKLLWAQLKLSLTESWLGDVVNAMRLADEGFNRNNPRPVTAQQSASGVGYGGYGVGSMGLLGGIGNKAPQSLPTPPKPSAPAATVNGTIDVNLTQNGKLTKIAVPVDKVFKQKIDLGGLNK